MFVLLWFVVLQASAQKSGVPFVYSVENTGAKYDAPSFFTPSQLPSVSTLPNPFVFSDGKKEVKKFKQWTKRRAEIAQEIQYYEIGQKPSVPMDSIDARMSGDTLIVDVHVNGEVLTLQTPIFYPRNVQEWYLH